MNLPAGEANRERPTPSAGTALWSMIWSMIYDNEPLREKVSADSERKLSECVKLFGCLGVCKWRNSEAGLLYGISLHDNPTFVFLKDDCAFGPGSVDRTLDKVIERLYEQVSYYKGCEFAVSDGPGVWGPLNNNKRSRLKLRGTLTDWPISQRRQRRPRLLSPEAKK
jgi:hypothetical protein